MNMQSIITRCLSWFVLLELIRLGQLNAQQVIVADSSTKLPIPYITLKQIEGSSGFVADQRGRILLNQIDRSASYSLSCIGYKTRSFQGQDLFKLDTILMPSSMLELEEVVIRPMTPTAFINEAMTRIPKNYVTDSSNAEGYYREWIRENNNFLNLNEAYIAFNQPGYLTLKDSFLIALQAGRCDAQEELQFMRKELEKDLKRQRKEAEKKDEAFDEEENAMTWEVIDPTLMLQLDPIRHPETPMHINDNNVDFLDSNSHDQYVYWYGKPERFDDKTLVVIQFEPQRNAKAPLFKGSVWIDQASMAFVKISFGFEKDAEKHLIPGYARALLWVYGLSYEINETLIEFVYQAFEDKWSLSSTYLKAQMNLEKRRIFSANDVSDFFYEGELLVQTLDKGAKALSGALFNPKELLSEQIKALDPNPWERFKQKGRSIRR